MGKRARGSVGQFFVVHGWDAGGKGKVGQEPGGIGGSGTQELGGKGGQEPGGIGGKNTPKHGSVGGKGTQEHGLQEPDGGIGGKGKQEPGKGKGKQEPGKGKGNQEPGEGKGEQEPGKGKGTWYAQTSVGWDAARQRAVMELWLWDMANQIHALAPPKGKGKGNFKGVMVVQPDKNRHRDAP